MKVTRKTYTTFSMEQLLPLAPPPEDRSRGVYYMPQNDEAAYSAAGRFFDEATKAIRAKSKDETAAVLLLIDRRGDQIFATAKHTKVEATE